MRMMQNSFTQIVSIGLVVSLFTGCSTVGLRDPVVSDRHVRTEHETIQAPGRAAASVRQSGTMLHVKAKHACEARSQDVVARTTRRERYIEKNENYTYAFYLYGGLSSVGGTYSIVDSRSSNPFSVTPGDDEAKRRSDANFQLGMGVFLAAMGVAMLSIAIVDTVRGSGTTEDTEEVTLSPEVSTVPCPGNAPYGNVRVDVMLGNSVAEVGLTNERGVLYVDLDVALDAAIVPDPKAAISVLVKGTTVGEIDSMPLYNKREERAWRSLNPAACLEPSTVRGCEPFEEFLNRFGDSSYAVQAIEVLEKGRAGILRIARQTEEEEAWAKINPTLCTNGTAVQSVSEAEAACDVVERHLARFPGGVHAAQASEALRKGRARIAVLKAGRRRGPVVVPESGGI